MFSIDAELRALLRQLHTEDVPYALCGALALAIYGYPRATLDIDVVALGGNPARVGRCGRLLGFTLEAAPMRFAGDRVRIDRLSKVIENSEDVLMLDILSLAPEVEERIQVDTASWHDTPVRVVTRSSLAYLKSLRGSAQDFADIEKLSSPD